MNTKHWNNDRQSRDNFINEILGGEGAVITVINHVDRGHPNGTERHEITSNGIINVYNERTGKLVTRLIARPAQIRRYYPESASIPNILLAVINIAREHQRLGYNKR